MQASNGSFVCFRKQDSLLQNQTRFLFKPGFSSKIQIKYAWAHTTRPSLFKISMTPHQLLNRKKKELNYTIKMF